MKSFSLKSCLLAAVAATTFLAAGTASAQDAQLKNMMMGFNPFQSGFLGTPTVSAPSYMIGLKTSENLLPFAYLSVADPGGNADTIFALGGGARIYLTELSQHVRTFAGGALGIVSADDTGFGIGGFFGAEAMITDGLSISGQIGAEIADSGCSGCDTSINLGTANVMFNLYF